MKYSITAFRNTADKSSAKANVKLNIGGQFDISGIHVREGKNGLFVAMPQYMKNDGEYQSIVNPTTAEFREKLYGEIISANSFLEKNPDRKTFINSVDDENPSAYKVTVHKVKNPDSPVKAMANINIDGQFSINNIIVRENSKGGLSAFMPSINTGDGQYVDLVKISEDKDKEVRENITSCVKSMIENDLTSFSKEFPLSDGIAKNSIAEYAKGQDRSEDHDADVDVDEDM